MPRTSFADRRERLNLAVADVYVLARAMAEFFISGSESLLQASSRDVPEAHLARRALLLVDDLPLHRFPERDGFPAPAAALGTGLPRPARARRRQAWRRRATVDLPLR